MKLTELIAELQEIVRLHGEAQIWNYCHRCGGALVNGCYRAHWTDEISTVYLTHECDG